MKSTDKLYEFHSANLRSVKSGLDHVYAAARLALAQRRDTEILTYVRLYAFSMGAWTECRLLKLLHEPAAFSEPERGAILKLTALERWLKTVEVAFRRHYSIPHAPLVPPALSPTAHARKGILEHILADDLKAVITLRNKLAHGQWVYPLNDSLNDVAQDQMDALRKETVLTLKQKASLIDSVCGAVHDLVVSKPTFERDFDSHFRHVEQIRVNVARKNYDQWRDQLRTTYERGRKDMRRRLAATG